LDAGIAVISRLARDIGARRAAIAGNAAIAKQSKLRRFEGVSETAVERGPSAEILSRTAKDLNLTTD
jgi:hypothetical protein